MFPIYNQQVAPPHKPSRSGLAGAQAQAMGQLGQGIERVGGVLAGYAGRMLEVARRAQLNEAVAKGRERYRTFWSELQRDPDYASYGKKYEDFYTSLREELERGAHLPGAKREIEFKMEQLHQDWGDQVGTFSDTRAIDAARTVRVQAINQAIQDKDPDRVLEQIREAGQGMEFEASDLAKLKDAGLREVIRDQTMEHARLMGAQGPDWLNSDEAEQLFAQQLGPEERYSLDKDTRQKMAEDLAQEREWAGKQQDVELDRTFADLHIGADTTDKVDAALGQLAATDFYDGDKKYQWEQRFKAQRAYLINLHALPKGALDDFYERNEDALWARLAIAKAHGLPLGALQQIVEDAYYGRDKEGTGKPKVRGSFVKAAVEYLEAKEDPVFNSGLKAIESKTAGLDDFEKARAVNDFRAWVQANPNADAKTMETAAENIARPVVQRDIDKWGRRSWEVLWGNKRVFDEFEQLAQDIEQGKYTGLTGSRQEYLARYNAYLVGKAQKEFPEEDIASVFTDTTGAYGGKPGTAIMVSSSGKPYAYKLEGKELTLYRLGKTRGGKYEWQEVGKAGQAKAEKTLAQLEKEQADKAAREAAAEVKRKEIGEITPESPRIGEWVYTGTRWVNEVSGVEASLEIAKTLDRQSGRVK